MKNCNTPEDQTTRRILLIACAPALAAAFTISLPQPAHAECHPENGPTGGHKLTERMKNETQHTAKSPAIPFFARYLERVRKGKTAAEAGVFPKWPVCV